MNAVKPYEYCASRYELRGMQPITDAAIAELVQTVRRTGVEAVIHSAVNQPMQPLFPSEVMPGSHPDADLGSMQRLIEVMHEMGRPVLSWIAMNHSQPVSELHPEWRMVDLEGEHLMPRNDNHAGQYLCPNSPWGRMLPDFAAEVAGRVGFDGIWFDGSSFAMYGNSRPGCACSYCRKRFKKDTDRILPRRVDWESETWRIFINWRYEVLMGFWRECLDAIQAAKPVALVAFNNYRRRRKHGAWETGIPIRSLGWDCLLSGELDLHALQGDFQMKEHLAMGCSRGVDSWMALCDDWQLWTPDVDRETVAQSAVSCVCAGGVLWMGGGVPEINPAPARVAQEISAPLLPFRGGDAIPYAAIWCSQATQDFHGRDASHEVWDDWHGANELCQMAHLPSAMVFDDQVEAGDILARYPILIAGECACISKTAANQIAQYVEAGGCVVACAEAGVYDELGRPHALPVLDKLLGISKRREGVPVATLELRDQTLIRALGEQYLTVGLSSWYVQPRKGTQRLADLVQREMGAWDNPAIFARRAGMTVRKHGRGRAIWVGCNPFRAFINTPKAALVRFIKELFSDCVSPPFELDAPMQVRINVREQMDGSRILMLHNAPGSIWRYGQSHSNSGEITTLHGLRLRFPEPVSAQNAFDGTPLTVGSDGWIALPPLYRSAVVRCRSVE